MSLPADVSPLQEKTKSVPAWKPKLRLLPVQFYPWLAAGKDDATRRSGTWGPVWRSSDEQTLSPARCKFLRANRTPSPPSQASGHLGLGLQKLFPRAKRQGAVAEADPFPLTKRLFLYPLVSTEYPAGGCRNRSFGKVSSVLLYIELDLGVWDGWFHPAARFLGVRANHLVGGCLNIF